MRRLAPRYSTSADALSAEMGHDTDERGMLCR